MFKDMKPGKKIFITIGLIIDIAVAIGLISYKSIATMRMSTREITEVRLPSVQSLLILRESQTAVARGELELINRKIMATEIPKAAYGGIESAWERADNAWKVYESLLRTGEESNLWRQFVMEWMQWKSAHRKVVDLCRERDMLVTAGLNPDDPQVEEIDKQVCAAYLQNRQPFLAAETALNKVIDENARVGAEESQRAETIALSAQQILISTMAISIIFTVLLGFFLARSITHSEEPYETASDQYAV